MEEFPEDIYTEPSNIDVEDTVLMIRGQTEPFHHADRNTLIKIAAPTPNPLAQR
jgi:hypothetical protein